MLDTIRISTEKFKIENYDLFIQENSNQSLKYVIDKVKDKNIIYPIKAHLNPINDGIYRPRVTYVYSTFKNPILYIEFSISKLLYGNNLFELREKDYNDVVKKLIENLKNLRIIVTENAVNDAFVRRVDFSKNYILKNDLTCKEVLDLLNKLSFFNRMKLKIIENDKCIKFYNKSMAILFYDKKEELKKSNTKFSEKIGKIYEQINSILRMEIQIKKTNILNQIARHYNIRKMTFQGIFKENIFKYIFDKYLKKINKNIPDMVTNEEELVDRYRNKPEELAKKVVILNAQEKFNDYKYAKQYIVKNYGNNFFKAHNCILIKNKDLTLIILQLLKEIKEYTPLFNET